MVPLLNRPLLAYQVALLRRHGVEDVILSCSYRVDDVRAALGDAALGARLRYVVEDEPLGTGGGVRNAADLTAGTVFVLNGDVLTDADLSAMREFHTAHGAGVTICLYPVDDPRPYGLVETGADGRILRFREKPGPGEAITTNTINAGIYLIDAALLRRIPTDRPVSIEREFFPAAIADGVPCFGWRAKTYWRDIGSPHAYRAAQIDLLLGGVDTTLAPPGTRRDGSWIAADAWIAPDAGVEAPSVIGTRAEVASGARVGPLTVLGDGCHIGRGARVEGAVLWERVEVGASAVLRDCVVGADVKIGPEAEIGPGVVLESGAVIPAHTRLDRPPHPR